MRDIPVSRVREFQDAFLERLRAAHAKDVLEPLGEGKLTPEIEALLTETASSVIMSF